MDGTSKTTRYKDIEVEYEDIWIKKAYKKENLAYNVNMCISSVWDDSLWIIIVTLMRNR